jgi:hypothetical protein
MLTVLSIYHLIWLFHRLKINHVTSCKDCEFILVLDVDAISISPNLCHCIALLFLPQYLSPFSATVSLPYFCCLFSVSSLSLPLYIFPICHCISALSLPFYFVRHCIPALSLLLHISPISSTYLSPVSTICISLLSLPLDLYPISTTCVSHLSLQLYFSPISVIVSRQMYTVYILFL